jgi:hypothetical protein
MWATTARLLPAAVGLGFILGACELFETREPTDPGSIEPIPPECQAQDAISATDVLRGYEASFGCRTQGEARFEALHHPDFVYTNPDRFEEAQTVQSAGVLRLYPQRMDELERERYEAELTFDDVSEQLDGDVIRFNEMTYRLVLTPEEGDEITFGGIVSLVMTAEDFLLTEWRDSDDGKLEALGSFYANGIGGRDTSGRSARGVSSGREASGAAPRDGTGSGSRVGS